ncbi:MAG: hypothetical protein PUI65_00225 [Prevotella sp.]|nr:hypothetical protein [Prevotella sp.]
MRRRGCIYEEEQSNYKGRAQSGRGTQGRLVKGVGLVSQTRRRWVAEISYHGKRFSFRSTDFNNVRSWLNAMSDRYSD